MAEAVPNRNIAATAFNPASNAQTEHGHPLPDAAHDLIPTDNEKSEAFPDSSNASTQLKPGSDAASNDSPKLIIKPEGDVANEKAPPGDQSEQVRKITGIKWVVVVLSIQSSTFLYALDNTVVADVEPKIVDSFGQIQKLPWPPVAFLVAAVSTNLIWYVDGYYGFKFPLIDWIYTGKIYGRLNAKWLYVFCIFLFEVGSALCGAAPTMNALIGGRVLAGLGGVGL